MDDSVTPKCPECGEPLRERMTWGRYLQCDTPTCPVIAHYVPERP